MKILISIDYLKFHQQKSLFFSYCIITNATDYKLSRLLNEQPKDRKNSMWARFTRPLTNLKKKISLHPTGETKDEKSEVEPEEDITKLQRKGEQPVKLSKPYEISYESGNQLSPNLEINEKTFVSEYITCFIAYSFFSKKEREEWMGDIYEINYELLSQGKPRWFVNSVGITRTVFFLSAKLKITANQVKRFILSFFITEE